jgi:prolipoprotein diacylglyceryltransferase
MLSRTIVAPTASRHKPGILSFPYFAMADVICPLILVAIADGRIG